MTFKVDLHLFFYSTVIRTAAELLFFAFLIIFFLVDESKWLSNLIKVVLVAIVFLYIFFDIYSYGKKKKICEEFSVILLDDFVCFRAADKENNVRYSDILMKSIKFRGGKPVQFKLVQREGLGFKLKNIGEMQVLYEELLSRGVRLA